MITLQTLDNISIEALLEVFNLSFSDYIVPFHLTKEQLQDKIKSDSVRLEFSVGAFEDNRLIAFLLHGYDIIDSLKVVYNAGMGVIPAKRGNRLTSKMYDYILPILHENSIDKVVLEVITTNETAVKTYQNIGFKIIRQLNCFKGVLNISTTNHDFEIRELEAYDWPKFQSFWDFKPTWQNSLTAVEQLKQSNVSIGIYDNETLIGYTIYNPKSKRIHQLAVDKNYRNSGIARKLLGYISTNHAVAIACLNIEDSSTEVLKFMTGIGTNVYIKQYEMEFNLN